MELKQHENRTKTLTPTREHGAFSWWLKWVASIILMFGMIATTNDLYPYNMFLQFMERFMDIFYLKKNWNIIITLELY